MKGPRAALYVVAFAGLAATAAVVVGAIATPTIAPLLVAAAAVGTLAGGPGIVRRRAWPFAFVLLPVGAYLLARAQVPVPSDVHGAGAQLAFYVEQLRSGARAYVLDVFPLEVAAKADVRLLLSLVMYAAVWLAALLALSLRRPLPAIVVVIVLLAFGFTTDASTRNVWATMAFLLLAGSMLVLSRSLQRERWKSSDIAAGAITATLAAVLAFSIIGATSVDAARPLRDWRTWDIAGVGSTHLRFDWMQNYPRLLDPANNERVMRVRSAVPSYWRANGLANFDGQSWWSDAPGTEPVAPAQKKGTYVYAVPPGGVEPPGRVVTESFEVENTYTNDLFIGGWPASVQISRPVDLRVGDARDLDVDPPLGPKLSYAVTALVPQLEPADLIERGRAYPAAVVEHYTDLPFPTLAQLDGPSPEALWNATMNTSPAAREWLGLYRLNASIVGDSTDPYRITLAVESYLRTKYTYSLAPPQPAAISPYAAFLFRTKSGYCQHFAGAMAALLRFNGIPARVAVGFTTGEKVAEGTYIVTRNDAHAWVEAYFPDVGWVPFDPTPGHALPVAAGDAPTSGPNAAVAGQNVPGVSLTAKPAAAAGPRNHDRNPVSANGGGAVAAAPASGSGWAPWAAALALVLVGWPVGRALLRRRGLHRGGPEERLGASLALVYASLRDHGIDVPRSQTLDETARYLRERLSVDTGDLPARTQAVLYGGRPATARDLADLAALRRRLRRRLREREGRVKTLLAIYGLRSPAPEWRPRLASGRQAY
jgi:transglutaminase-like putative cysteine protease